MNGLVKTIQYIVGQSEKLRNKYTSESAASIEFTCIFCQSEKEYENFTRAIESLGKIAEDTPMGFTYLLDEPLDTNSGELRLIKIRKPDLNRKERGDADFNTNYLKLKKKYINDPNFEFIKRDNFEMLRLSDPGYDVMACFSSIPKSNALGIKL